MLYFRGSSQVIEMNISNIGQSFRIKTTKLNDEFKIVYMRRDTSDSQKIQAEMKKMGVSLALVAQNFGPLGPEKAREKAKEYYAMVDRYTYFRKDSISFKAHSEPAFTKAFTTLLITPQNTLNKDHRTGRGLLMDGVFFFWKIADKAPTKEVAAHTPSAQTHPLLYPYIKSILAIYRKQINGSMFKNFYYYEQ